jgi:cytochrome c oxidase assembly protein subunit 15
MTDLAATATGSPAELRLARGFGALSAITLGLIMVGALVRAHDAGLACPDWPLCKGAVVPEFDLKVAFEWGHRVFAGSVSIGLVVLSVIGLRRPGLRALLVPRLVFAWCVLLAQITFGALTVKLLLAPWTVSVHLVLGNLFCLALLWISRDLYESQGARRDELTLPAIAKPLCLIVSFLLLLQIVLGGMVSSHYAGLACTTFPTCDGQSIAPTLEGAVGMQVLHRINGVLLLIAYALVAAVVGRGGRVTVLATTGLGLVLLQVAVGVLNVLLRLPMTLTGLHTAIAAAIVLVTALLVRDVMRARGALPSRAPIAEAG